MRRIDRYLLSEMLTPALVGGVMVLMLLVGNVLYILLRLLYSGSSGSDIVRILLLRLPEVTMQALPAALLLGTALALNRLERDRELMSLRMAGVRLKRLVLPYIVLGLLAAAFLFFLQEQVIPRTSHAAQKLTNKLAWGTPTAVVPRDTVFKIGPNFLYVREVDRQTNTLRGVVACQIKAGAPPVWLTIPVAENHNGHWFFKRDPVTHEPPKMYILNVGYKPIYGEVEGQDSWLNLKQDVLDFMTDQVSSAQELSFKELRELARGVRGTGYGAGLMLTPHLLTFQLHRKLATPLAALVAILIAIPLSVHFGRSGGHVGLLLSVVVAFCFVVSQQWAQVLAETARLHPIIAAWLPNVFYGLLGTVLLAREE